MPRRQLNRELRHVPRSAPTYTLQTAACTSVTQTASPASPQAPGASVQFTATATGCPNPNL